MIQNIVKVKSTTTLQGKKGPYLSVVWTDGDKEFKKNVFEPAYQKVFQQAEKSGESVKVGVEKEGDFWNIKAAEITSEEVSQKATVSPSGEKARSSETGQRYYHDRHSADAEDWTNIRTAVMQAVALETHLVPGAKADVKGVMQNAAEIFADMCMMKPTRGEK